MSLNQYFKFVFMSLLIPVLSFAVVGEPSQTEFVPVTFEESLARKNNDWGKLKEPAIENTIADQGYGGFLEFFAPKRALGQVTRDLCGKLIEQVINVAAFRDNNVTQEQLLQRLDLIGLSDVFINLQVTKKKDSTLPDRINVTSFDPNRSYFLRKLDNKYVLESGFVSGSFEHMNQMFDSPAQGCYQTPTPQPEKGVSERIDSNKTETPATPSTPTVPTVTPVSEVTTGS